MKGRTTAALAAALAALAVAGCNQERRDGDWQVPHGGQTVADPVGHGWALSPEVVAPGDSWLLTLACGLALGAVLGRSLLLMRAHRRQAESEESIDPVAPLRAGPFVVVGTVEADERWRCPVSVRVEQTGQESHGKHGWHHRWTETRREVTSQPFVVRRDDGVRVAVEPGRRVVLHDQLSRREKAKHTFRRVRIAEITAGDRVFVSGTMSQLATPGGGVYRDAPGQPRLVPSSLAPMVISTEPPGDTARSQLRLHRLWALLAMGAIGALGSFAAGTYLLRALAGRTIAANIDLVRPYEIWHKPKNKPGYWVAHTEAALSWPRGDQRTSERVEIADDLFACALQDGCTKVVVLEADLAGVETWQLGSQATLGVANGMALLLGTGATLALWLIHTRRARPWYARRRLVEKGSGRLT